MASNLHYSLDEANQTATLTLLGEITIQHATELHSLLVQAVQQVNHLEINLKNLSKADLSTVQLLCSTYRQMKGNGKNFLFAKDVSDAFLKLIEATGYKGCLEGIL
ncbi:MAG: STAS domain-containing protein [Magnetococcus sp. DMHC-6]